MKRFNDTFVKLKISILFLVVFILTFTANCKYSDVNEPHQDSTLTAELTEGMPVKLAHGLNEIKKQMKLSNFSHASLKTGIDSLEVYFGMMKQGSREGYWISAYNKNGSTWNWSTTSLVSSDTLKFSSDPIDIAMGGDKNPQMISLKVIHLPGENFITYTWLENGKRSLKAAVTDVATPIRINKPFPELELELLNGGSINIKHLAGNYVVINWWNTGCRPCIAGIPQLNELVEKYKHRGVFFLSVAYDKRERVENLVKQKKFKFTHALGTKKSAELFGESYPKYLILDPGGKVIFYSSGGSENRYNEIDKILSVKMKS